MYMLTKKAYQHQSNQMLLKTAVDVPLSQDQNQIWQLFRKDNDLWNDIPLAHKKKVVGIRSGSNKLNKSQRRIPAGHEEHAFLVCILLKTNLHLWERWWRPESKTQHMAGLKISSRYSPLQHIQSFNLVCVKTLLQNFPVCRSTINCYCDSVHAEHSKMVRLLTWCSDDASPATQNRGATQSAGRSPSIAKEDWGHAQTTVILCSRTADRSNRCVCVRARETPQTKCCVCSL